YLAPGCMLSRASPRPGTSTTPAWSPRRVARREGGEASGLSSTRWRFGVRLPGILVSASREVSCPSTERSRCPLTPRRRLFATWGLDLLSPTPWLEALDDKRAEKVTS